MPAGARFELEFPARRQTLGLVRGAVRSRLEWLGADEDLVDSVVLVIDELVNNAIDHGGDYRAGDARLRLAIALERDEVRLLFEDPEVPGDIVREIEGRLSASRNGTPPPVDSPRGRGLFLIAAAIEDLQVAVSNTGGLRLTGRIAGV